MKKQQNGKINQPFRVAMIGQKRIPSREGGVEVVVLELSSRLVDSGYQVDAYNRSGYHVSGKEFDDGRGQLYKGIRIVVIPTFKNGKLNAIVYAFLGTIRALFGRYDVIHYHAEGPCSMLWIPKIFGIRIVATIHGLDWQRAKWGGFASAVLKFGERMAAKYADEVIVLSKNVQQYFTDTYHRKTVYIPNGIAKPEKKEADLISRQFGLQKDSYILFLARLVPEKGLHYLIKAYEKLDTDKKLVIAGGSSHSFEYIETVHKLAKNNPHIIFTDFVQGETLQELYSNAYLFVLPSDVEGMAISLLEAMSYGNCCLVSDIAENVEVVGDYAPTFRRSDVQDLKEKLELLLHDPNRVRQYKEKSGEYTCSKYNWDKVLDETIRLYHG